MRLRNQDAARTIRRSCARARSRACANVSFRSKPLTKIDATTLFVPPGDQIEADIGNAASATFLENGGREGLVADRGIRERFGHGTRSDPGSDLAPRCRELVAGSVGGVEEIRTGLDHERP